MTSAFNFAPLAELRAALEHHPVYAAVRTPADLRCFMEHHVFSVWDFMSLVKYLQSEIAPPQVPWTPAPHGDGPVRYFINQLVLEEESDAAPRGSSGPSHLSHFELYVQAMGEVGADTERPRRFIERVRRAGIDSALASGLIPEPARRFVAATFEFIHSGAPHRVAAALAFGREQVIPMMFRALLERMGIGERDAPSFHYYLRRHIHLDEGVHGPLSVRMVEALCEGSERRLAEAREAAAAAVRARLAFWDDVAAALESRTAA